MLTQIDHVGIACRDLEEKISFYCSTFGLTVASREVNEEQGVREAMLLVATAAPEAVGVPDLRAGAGAEAGAPGTDLRATAGAGGRGTDPRAAAAGTAILPPVASYIQLLEPLRPGFAGREVPGTARGGHSPRRVRRGRRSRRARGDRRERGPAGRRAPAARLDGRLDRVPPPGGCRRGADRIGGASGGPYGVLTSGRDGAAAGPRGPVTWAVPAGSGAASRGTSPVPHAYHEARCVIAAGLRKCPLRRTDIRSMSVMMLIDRKQGGESRESAAGKSEGTDNVPKAE